MINRYTRFFKFATPVQHDNSPLIKDLSPHKKSFNKLLLHLLHINLISKCNTILLMVEVRPWCNGKSLRQKRQVAGSSSGINLSKKKKFRGKANYQSPPPNPTKVGALCIGYDHISYSIHKKKITYIINNNKALVPKSLLQVQYFHNNAKLSSFY
jgi:hypothetical protein